MRNAKLGDLLVCCAGCLEDVSSRHSENRGMLTVTSLEAEWCRPKKAISDRRRWYTLSRRMEVSSDLVEAAGPVAPSCFSL